MRKRKPPRTARSKKSITLVRSKPAHKLRQLSEDEARDTYQAAKKAKKKKVHGPIHLRDAWWRWRYSHKLAGFVADLRFSIKDPELDDPSLVAGHLARFIELMVVRFERLVEIGQSFTVAMRVAICFFNSATVVPCS